MATNEKHVDFIGVGAPKCGTTWIYKCLDEHPEICMGRPKEIHFFNKDHGFESKQQEWQYPKGMDTYWAHFSHCAASSMKGEFSAKYLYDKEAPVLIKKHFPEVKIIVCMRDPADRTFSHYHHVRSREDDFDYTLEQAIERYPELLGKSKYHGQLTHYLKLFPKEQFLFLVYEDSKKEPLEYIQGIFTFLGVDDTFVPNSVNTKFNTAEQRYSEKHKKIRKPIFRVYAFLRKIRLVAPILRLAKKRGVLLSMKKGIDKAALPKKGLRPVMTDEERSMLDTHFAEDTQKLEGFLGKRITQWN